MFDSLQTTSNWIAWTVVHYLWIGVCVWFLIQLIRWPFSKSCPVIAYRANLLGLLTMLACFPLAASAAEHVNLLGENLFGGIRQ